MIRVTSGTFIMMFVVVVVVVFVFGVVVICSSVHQSSVHIPKVNICCKRVCHFITHTCLESRPVQKSDIQTRLQIRCHKGNLILHLVRRLCYWLRDQLLTGPDTGATSFYVHSSPIRLFSLGTDVGVRVSFPRFPWAQRP